MDGKRGKQGNRGSYIDLSTKALEVLRKGDPRYLHYIMENNIRLRNEIAPHFFRRVHNNGPKFIACRLFDRLISSYGPRTEQTWAVVKRHYGQLNYEVNDYNREIDPLAVHWVDPDDIQLITGRDWKPWSDPATQIGSVRDGDWDRTRSTGAPDHYPRKYADYPLYDGARKHIEDGVAWEDTEIYEIIRQRGQKHVTAMNKLRRIDELFETLKRDGYRTQKELYLSGEGENTVLNTLLNEITVDVGRNGELLFVDSRHRLSVAKILDLDYVPVVVLTWHQQWVEGSNSGLSTLS